MSYQFQQGLGSYLRHDISYSYKMSRIQDLFRITDLVFLIQDSTLRRISCSHQISQDAQGSGVQGLVFRVQDFTKLLAVLTLYGFRVQGLGFRVQGLGLRGLLFSVQGLGLHETSCSESLVNPKSTSNQSSKPCTVLQYPSKKKKKCLEFRTSRNILQSSDHMGRVCFRVQN